MSARAASEPQQHASPFAQRPEAAEPRALVTGAGGFLGLYLVEQLLSRGYQVRGFCRGSYPQLSALGIEVQRGDLRDAAAVDRACRSVDVVFHAASLAGIWGPSQAFEAVNVAGTRHLIEACRRRGVRRLIYTSTPSVTFDGHPQCGVDERAPYPQRWLCHYARTKALAEQLVLAAHDATLMTCALRPHLIWGPRDSHLVPRLLARAQRGHLRIVGDGTNRIDMVYVENAAHAHLLAAERLVAGSPVGGRAYFITQGEPVNCWDWINEILALAELEPVRRRIGAGLARAAGGVLELVWSLARRRDEPRMTRFLAAQLSTSHYFNIAAARRDLGYQPLVDTAEGMRRLGAWLSAERLARGVQ